MDREQPERGFWLFRVWRVSMRYAHHEKVALPLKSMRIDSRLTHFENAERVGR